MAFEKEYEVHFHKRGTKEQDGTFLIAKTKKEAERKFRVEEEFPKEIFVIDRIVETKPWLRKK